MRRMTMSNNELVVKVYHSTQQPRFNMAKTILSGIVLYFLYSETRLAMKLDSENRKLKREIEKLKEE